MTPEWQLSRTFMTCPEGQRRWDCAYQLLVRWTMAPSSTATQVIALAPEEDKHDGICLICPRFDQPATTESKH
jgi:hypothetical protein